MNENLQKMLNEMIENKELMANSPNRLKNLFKLLPFSNSFFNLVNKKGIPISKLVTDSTKFAGEMEKATKNANAAQGLTVTQSVFAGIDLLLLPVIFFLYFDKHDKKYYTLSNAAKLTYSTATLSLVTLSIFFPPVAAITAGLCLLGVATTVGNHLFKMNRVAKQFKSVTSEIKELDSELKELAAQAKELIKDPEPDPQTIKNIKELYKKFQVKQGDKQNKLDHQKSLIVRNILLSRKRGLIDKMFGVAAAVIALSGLLIAIVLLPVGLLIIAGVAATSVIYIAGRFIQEAGGAMFSKYRQKESDDKLKKIVNKTDPAFNSKENSLNTQQQASPIQEITVSPQNKMSREAVTIAILNKNMINNSWKNFILNCLDFHNVEPETKFIKNLSLDEQIQKAKMIADFDNFENPIALELAVSCILKAMCTPANSAVPFAQTSMMQKFVEKFNAGLITGEVKDIIYGICEQKPGEILTVDDFTKHQTYITQLSDVAIEQGFNLQKTLIQ